MFPWEGRWRWGRAAVSHPCMLKDKIFSLCKCFTSSSYGGSNLTDPNTGDDTILNSSDTVSKMPALTRTLLIILTGNDLHL